MVISRKMIISGSCVEVYDYERGLYVDNQSMSVNVSYSPSVNLRRLIFSNLYRWRADNNKAYLPLFLTLTFKGELSAELARQRCKLFFQRFARWRKSFDGGVNKYVCVMEFTKKGRPHFHMIVFNLPFVPNIYDVLNMLWGEGYLIVKSVKRDGYNVAFYLAKYLVKSVDCDDGDKKKRSRSYWSSNGLYRSIVLLHDYLIVDVMSYLVKLNYLVKSEYSYPSFACGEIYYRMYVVLDDGFDVSDSVFQDNSVRILST